MNPVKNFKACVYLWISQCIYVFMGAPWFFIALMATMGFDNPDTGSASFKWLMLLYIVNWLYPIALLFSAGAAWALYHLKKFKAAVWVNQIPLLWLVPLIVLLVYVMAA
ncbi:hypothetical protein [Cohnella thailandensis]|uniref:Uncharacterized protein n=1 Tax=Cohnella thailandensis TaxID=557557 RepID=A0A841T154_9BACL|nr:hypothetical protein [Cohnella thailandensis]MBB6637272.1 hypothetical protein [Cohnella thailandensis]MBP1976600.1 hypothetical protein [Cohnella thailandensis]